MAAILGGLGAALMWAAATVAASRSARLIGPGSVLAWVMTIGLLILLPVLALTGIPAGLDDQAPWLAVAGVGNVAGLLLEYAGLRTGKVGIVAPIASTEGGVAALIAVAAGERVARGTGAVLALIAVGIVVAALTPDRGEEPAMPHRGGASLYAMAAALAFGFSIYATGHLSTRLPIAWVILPARMVGVLGVAVPLSLSGRLRLTRRALPLVITSGVCEVAGFAFFALGARHGIAVSAVLGSQFAALSAVGAYVLFHERLARVQLIGIAAIIVGVTLLSSLRA